MKKFKMIFCALLSVLMIFNVSITAFADEATQYSQTGDVYKQGEGDYVFEGRNGVYLTDDTPNVGDSPYSATSSDTTGLATKATDGSAAGDYSAGHAFDVQYSPDDHNRAAGLKDTPILGRYEALSADEYVKVVHNGDGNYTATIYRKTSPAPQPTPSSDPTPDPEPSYEPQQEEPSEPPVEEQVQIISTNTGDALPTTELGEAQAITKSVVLDLSKVTPAQYNEVVSDVVRKVPENGIAVIETDQPATLTTSMIETFAERSDVAITVVFKDAGVKKRVIIPAGYDVQSLLDENGYCGFLRLAAILGFTIIE